MNCSDVVNRFTDYLDRNAGASEAAAIERHLERCPSCVRYKAVLERGAGVLRSLPRPELRDDFAPRLQHRLFHVDDERTLVAHAASGAPALTVVGIAILLTAVAWSPSLLSDAPVVELAPIVVDRAPARSSVRPASATPPGTFSTTSELDQGLWANTLLYDYTPLSQRYEQRARVTGVGQLDR